MREKVLKFGDSASLVGIVTEPAPGARDGGERPTVIILNSGILHRIGTCRMSVKIARRLAARGYTSVRFDSSGIGDSGPRRDALAFEQSAPLEVQELMSLLERTRGAGGFVLMGLCSGADVAYETARIDRRVRGIVQLDPYSYRNLRYYFYFYWPRITSPAKWVSVIRNRIAAWRTRGERGSDDLELPTYVRVFPPRAEVHEGMRTLAANDVSLFAIYTGGGNDYAYPRQFHDLFSDVPFNRNLRVEHVTTSDHMVTTLPEQARVLDMIEAWVVGAWGAATAVRDAPQAPRLRVAAG
jgi:pimeloyl-ACP methyl ester carboxylesterase